MDHANDGDAGEVRGAGFTRQPILGGTRTVLESTYAMWVLTVLCESLATPPTPTYSACFLQEQALMLPPWYLLKVLIALLPYTNLGRAGAKHVPSITRATSEFASRTSAWVTPPLLSRRLGGGGRSRGLRCAMGSTAQGGAGGAAGNQASGRGSKDRRCPSG